MNQNDHTVIKGTSLSKNNVRSCVDFSNQAERNRLEQPRLRAGPEHAESV